METQKQIIKTIWFIFFALINASAFGQFTPVKKIDSNKLPDANQLIIDKSTHQGLISSQPFLFFDSKHLPFFCKIEHKIEKTSPIALRFRLGDLNYVNMLESKNK